MGFLDLPIGIPEAAAAVTAAAAPDLRDASELFFRAQIWHLLLVKLPLSIRSHCRASAVLPHLTSAFCGPDVTSLPPARPRHLPIGAPQTPVVRTSLERRRRSSGAVTSKQP